MVTEWNVATEYVCIILLSWWMDAGVASCGLVPVIVSCVFWWWNCIEGTEKSEIKGPSVCSHWTPRTRSAP